jgi:hypothetical protein
MEAKLMYKIRSIDIGNTTYFTGCLTRYEISEQERTERHYMIIQKLIGVSLIIIAALSMLLVKVDPEIGIFIILVFIIGVIFTLSNKHVICL